MLKREPAGPCVLSWIEGRGARVSWINLGEVYYAQARLVGEERSRAAVDAIRQAVVAELPDEALILAAASIKSQHTISYADCFAVATAERHREPVLTGDPELLELSRPELEVIDVRAAT